MRSDRFYWCVGCGKWHDPLKGQSVHFCMYCPQQEPNESNFEGTPEDLARFLTARQLAKEDDEAFESRIDARLP